MNSISAFMNLVLNLSINQKKQAKEIHRMQIPSIFSLVEEQTYLTLTNQKGNPLIQGIFQVGITSVSWRISFLESQLSSREHLCVNTVHCLRERSICLLLCVLSCWH